VSTPADPTLAPDEYNLSTVVGDPDDATLAEPSAPRRRDHDGVAMPDRLGRYLVVDMLGEGGMGVVYRGYDPELDRKVAIKLLRGQASESAAVRLQREAQAMAKLSHPNVVPVYDVGTWEGQVFVAMAYVPGTTLRAWLDAKPRSWREIIDVFVAAGRGLSAAHAQGIVHRDFKPDNVLVADPTAPGQERLVQVLDFGLAKGIAGDASPREPTEPLSPSELVTSRALLDSDGSRGGSRLSTQLTREGTVLGTPAYMSPEQHGGHPTDASTDQFSFCVALYEALYGRRPFAGSDYKSIALSVLEQQLLPPPPDNKVPARLWPLLERGLAHAPAQRWADLASLLGALTDDPSERRRNYVLVAAVGVAFAATLSWGLRTPDPVAIVESPPRCQGASDELAGVWDPVRAQAIARTFAARSDSWAPDVAAEVKRRLDAWAERWVQGRTDACEATELRAEQSAELMDLRIVCYDRKLAALAPIIELLANADDQVARKAVDVVASLPSIEPCDDAEGLRAAVPPPDDPALATQVDDIRKRLAEAHSMALAGRLELASANVDALVDRAALTGYSPLKFEALRTQGWLLERTGKHEQATPILAQALHGALAVRDDEVALDVIETLTALTGYHAGNYDEGMRWAELGQVVLTRQTNPASPHHADLGMQIGMIEFQAGHYEAARERIELALELERRRLGDDHPKLAPKLDVLGAIELRTGNYQRAAEIFRRSLALVERTRGRTHPDLAPPLNNLALAHERLAEFDEAAAMLARVLELLTTTYGAKHPNVGLIESNLGGILLLAGELERARPHLDTAVTTLEQALGPEHQLVGRALTMRGDVELAAGQVDRALASYQRSLEIRRTALGPDHVDLALSHLGLGNALLAADRSRDAVLELERAVVLLTSGDGSDPIDRGLARFALARALASSGARDRVPELSDAAREDFVAGGVRAAADLAKLEAWEAAQP
jgi:serine/threonine protein kinase/tetratricopeptide (TPR) repeat protein